jgi:hypothetical protein
MHTAFSLKSSMFEVEMHGQAADRKKLLNWQVHDRLGVVLKSPLGGLGASMLMQLAVTAYFDARSGRRDAPHYAEIYLFHSGGRYGDFSSFDIVPHREVFLPADPGSMIEALNDRAITHLVVPDGTPRNLSFPWKEPESARDRIRCCYAYTAKGRTSNADISIRSRDPVLLEDFELALDPIKLAENIEGYINAGDADVQLFSRKLADRVRGRVNEISEEDKFTARQYYSTALNGGGLQQTFRKISVDTALSLL